MERTFPLILYGAVATLAMMFMAYKSRDIAAYGVMLYGPRFADIIFGIAVGLVVLAVALSIIHVKRLSSYEYLDIREQSYNIIFVGMVPGSITVANAVLIMIALSMPKDIGLQLFEKLIITLLITVIAQIPPAILISLKGRKHRKPSQ